MAGGEWIDVGIKAGISLVSGLGGLLIGVWKWGRSSAQKEQAFKDDLRTEIAALREEVRKDMTSHSQKVDGGNDLLVSQFKESFEGLRRQHDVFVLDVERRFLPKDDFRDFLQEYREDQRRTDDKLDRLLGAKSQ
jgi:hypothetical protein